MASTAYPSTLIGKKKTIIISGIGKAISIVNYIKPTEIKTSIEVKQGARIKTFNTGQMSSAIDYFNDLK